MKKEIRSRLNGLEYLIQSLYRNFHLMQYLAFNLHDKTFNLLNNEGLYWIYGQIMGYQIVTLYKVMITEEKHSFTKIINVAKAYKCDINFPLLERETKALKDIYDKTNLEILRSKYIAHQDFRMPKAGSDLTTIELLTNKTIELFLLFSNEFKGRKVKFSNNTINSLRNLFNTIDEYGFINTGLLAEKIKGNNIVEISRIASWVKKYRREIRNTFT